MPLWKQWRASGGGVLLDLGSHHFDLLRWFPGEEIAAVEARIESRVSDEDEAFVSLRMESGTEVKSFFSLQAARADFMEFIGENGTLRVDGHRPTLSPRVNRRMGYGVRDGWIAPGKRYAALENGETRAAIVRALLPPGARGPGGCHSEKGNSRGQPR